jgi:hypothetical protein
MVPPMVLGRLLGRVQFPLGPQMTAWPVLEAPAKPNPRNPAKSQPGLRPLGPIHIMTLFRGLCQGDRLDDCNTEGYPARTLRARTTRTPHRGDLQTDQEGLSVARAFTIWSWSLYRQP